VARPRVGVLSLLGDFARHGVALAALGAEPVRVSRPEHLAGLAALIVPGGESTTMLRLMAATGLRAPLEEFVHGHAVLGTCAGLVLLAKDAGELPAPTLGLLDVSVERNAYGRQIDSFSRPVEVPALGGPFDAVFIRAPRIRRVGADIEVVARAADGEPVAVRAGRVAGLAFHPELTPDRRLHRWFLVQVAGLALPADPVGVPAGPNSGGRA
jgi:pyridoxal 5'-phosphate synthase pdxT subunit